METMTTRLNVKNNIRESADLTPDEIRTFWNIAEDDVNEAEECITAALDFVSRAEDNVFNSGENAAEVITMNAEHYRQITIATRRLLQRAQEAVTGLTDILLADITPKQ